MNHVNPSGLSGRVGFRRPDAGKTTENDAPTGREGQGG